MLMRDNVLIIRPSSKGYGWAAEASFEDSNSSATQVTARAWFFKGLPGVSAYQVNERVRANVAARQC